MVNFICGVGNTKYQALEGNTDIISTYYRSNESKNVSNTYVTIESFLLKIRYLVEDIIENDVTCNTKYILSAMEYVGKVLRYQMNWVSMTDYIYLITYNVGDTTKRMLSKNIRLL